MLRIFAIVIRRQFDIALEVICTDDALVITHLGNSAYSSSDNTINMFHEQINRIRLTFKDFNPKISIESQSRLTLRHHGN